MPRPHRAEALSDDACLTSDVCLSVSVAYIVPKSGTKRPRNTKIGTEVAHVTVTRTPKLSGSKGQRSTCRGEGILWRPPAQLVSAVVNQ